MTTTVNEVSERNSYADEAQRQKHLTTLFEQIKNIDLAEVDAIVLGVQMKPGFQGQDNARLIGLAGTLPGLVKAAAGIMERLDTEFGLAVAGVDEENGPH